MIFGHKKISVNNLDFRIFSLKILKVYRGKNMGIESYGIPKRYIKETRTYGDNLIKEEENNKTEPAKITAQDLVSMKFWRVPIAKVFLLQQKFLQLATYFDLKGSFIKSLK